MPKSLSAEAILFAINSALRLSQSIRRAYANSLRSRSILLPLPSFDNKPNPFTINRFFDLEGARFVEEIEALKYLHRKNQVETLRQEELNEYQEYYRSLFFIVTEGDSNPQIREAGLNTEDLISLLKIRQWEKGSHFASTTLQLVAGTIVEIGIDYFNQFPKSIQRETVMGQALSRLLSALDTIPFSEEEDFKKAVSHKIIPRLFITAVETIQELPDEWIRDEKLRQFIEFSCKGMSEDLYRRISPDLSTDEMDASIHWGQLLLSSLIKNAGHTAFSSPHLIFGQNKGQEQLISSTGLIIMDLLFAEDELKIDLKNIFSSHTLDVLIKNAFIIFADYPELLAKDVGLRSILKETSIALAESPIPLSRLLPDILRIILEKTARHLPSIWDYEEEDTRHLLVTTLKLFLEALSRSSLKEPMQISSQQILELLDFLMEEVARHPKLLKKIGIGEEDEEEAILFQEMLSLVFDCVFHEKNKAHSHLEKIEQLKVICKILFSIVLKKFPDGDGKEAAILMLSPEEGLGWTHRPDILKNIAELLLAFLEDQAIQLSKDPVLRKVLSELVQLFRAYWPKHEDGILDFLQLILGQLARQTEYLFTVEEDEVEYLMVVAVKYLLEALSQSREATSLPELNEGQKIHLFSFLLEEILERPAWVTAKIGPERLISKLINLSFESLRKIPAAQRSSMATITQLIDINMRAIAMDTRVLNKIRWSSDEEERAILEKLIELVFDFIFNKTESGSLQKTEAALALLDFLIARVLQRHPNHLGLQIAAFLLEEDPSLQLSNGINKAMVDLYLETLMDIITTHPDIISPNPNIQQIITGVAQSLQESGLDRPGLLPRVLQLVLLQTADQIEIEEVDGNIKEVLIEALRQILKALSFNPEKGQWKPIFTGDHILEIVLYLLEEISESPDWVDEDEKVYQTLHIIFESLERIPRHRRPSFSLIKLMIIKLFEAAKNHPGYLNSLSTEEGKKRIILRMVLEYLFQAIYNRVSIKATLDVIHQPSVMDALLDYYLYRTSFHPIEEAAIREAADQVGASVQKLDEGHLTGSEDFLDELRAHLA